MEASLSGAPFGIPRNHLRPSGPTHVVRLRVTGVGSEHYRALVKQLRHIVTQQHLVV